MSSGKEFCLTYLKIPLKTIEERINDMSQYGKISAKL